MEPLSDNSQVSLKETVFQLVTHNQHFDQLVKEVSGKSDLNTEEYGHVAELCCLSLLKSQSLQLGTNNKYGTDKCVTFLASIMRSCKGPLLTQSQKREVKSVITALHDLLSEGSVDKTRFYTILQQHNNWPLEFLWFLAKDGIIRTGIYIAKKCNSSGFIADFSSQIKQVISEDENNGAAINCLTGIFTELVETIFSDRKLHCDTTTLTAINSILDRAVLDFIDLVLDKPDTMATTFVKVFEKLDVSMETMKKVVSHLLSLVLSYKPITKVSQAIQLQVGWCYSKAPVSLINWYKQLLLPLTTSEVLEKLQRILEQQEVNWQLLLTFVSTMIVCLTESQKTFLDFTDRLLQEGLEHCDMESVITGLLLVRQACFHGPHVFMSYADWFQRTFSESSRSLANNRKSFTFLLKFLTDIMPYETASHLKVHILRPPFVPSKCRDLLSDYILLAKTRLEDLKESLEISGQEDSRGADESKQQELLQNEVENAVSVYESTGKIPSSIMEASIFKKPFYIGRFLPALLKPRPLPTVPDPKMKLIEALKKAEKIPSSMHTTYEKACKKETLQLTEGLFLDVDSDDDMELSPFEQLENTLNQLHLAVQYVCGNTDEVPKFNVTEAASNVCDKTEAFLNISPDQPAIRQCSVVLDIDKLGIPHNSLKVIDALLNSVCQMIHTTHGSPNIDFGWLAVLLKGITQYSMLVKDFLARICSLIISQAQTLENHHIDSLAAILVELQQLSNQLPCIQLSGNCPQCCLATRTFTEHVFGMVSVSDGRMTAFTLRLTASYIKYLISSQDKTSISSELVPAIVVKKLMYTATRLLPEARFMGLKVDEAHQSEQFIVALLRSPLFENLLRNVKFTFSDWLNYEIRVDSDNDVLNDMERYEYYSWAVYQHFLSMSVENGGFSQNFRQAASNVLQILVEWDCRCKDQHPDCQKCKQNISIRSSGRNHLVSLLQEMTRMFDDYSDAGGESGLPWLPRQLISLCENVQSEIQKQAIVTAFFRIGLCLSAYLMFSDRYHSDAIPSIDKISKFLNSYLVEYVTEGVYLPVSFTLYMLQGLKLATSEDTFTKSLDSLCSLCPVISVSVLVHYNHLEAFLDTWKMSATVSEVLRAVECLRYGTHVTLDVKSEDWLSAAILFSEAIKCNFSFEKFSQSITSARASDKVLALFADLLLMHWTSLHFDSHHQVSAIQNIPNFVVKLLQGASGAAVLASLLNNQEDSLPSHCVRRAVFQLRSIAVIRVISHLPTKMFAQKFGSSLNDLLKLFAEVAQTFERINLKDYGEQGLQMFLSLDELLQYNRFVKEVLLSIPVRILKTIPKDLILACGSDVTVVVQRLLSRS